MLGNTINRINKTNANSQNDIDALIAAKLATGKFTDTGAKYTPETAQRDSNNSNLRLTAKTDDNGNLIWER